MSCTLACSVNPAPYLTGGNEGREEGGNEGDGRRREGMKEMGGGGNEGDGRGRE